MAAASNIQPLCPPLVDLILEGAMLHLKTRVVVKNTQYTTLHRKDERIIELCLHLLENLSREEFLQKVIATPPFEGLYFGCGFHLARDLGNRDIIESFKELKKVIKLLYPDYLKSHYYDMKSLLKK